MKTFEDDINRIVKKLLKNWFVVTPKSKDCPEGDVWGMDTSIGGIDEVKKNLADDIKRALFLKR